MGRIGAAAVMLCMGAPAALAQGSGMGPDNGADPQSMSAASAASARGHHRTVMSGHEGMSHTRAVRDRAAQAAAHGADGGSN